MGPKKLDFFFQKSSKFEFWLLTKNWNHLSFVNISPTLVIDTSTERSSRVLQHGNQKIWFFFSKKFEIEFDLYFDLCWRAEIIQVGLNMHLYVDIGDASSSLWGSTSSFDLVLVPYSFFDAFGVHVQSLRLLETLSRLFSLIYFCCQLASSLMLTFKV